MSSERLSETGPRIIFSGIILDQDNTGPGYYWTRILLDLQDSGKPGEPIFIIHNHNFALYSSFTIITPRDYDYHGVTMVTNSIWGLYGRDQRLSLCSTVTPVCDLRWVSCWGGGRVPGQDSNYWLDKVVTGQGKDKQRGKF